MFGGRGNEKKDDDERTELKCGDEGGLATE